MNDVYFSVFMQQFIPVRRILSIGRTRKMNWQRVYRTISPYVVTGFVL